MTSVLTRYFPIYISVCLVALLFCIPGQTANRTSSSSIEIINQMQFDGNHFDQHAGANSKRHRFQFGNQNEAIESLLTDPFWHNTRNEQTLDGIWQDRKVVGQQAAKNGPKRYRALMLNTTLFERALREVPIETIPTSQTNTFSLDLPLPDGSYSRFAIEESPIMEQSLAARFPEIRTYRGQGIDDLTATTRFDWTPQGFHAIVLSAAGTVLIEPETTGQISNYIAYFQSDAPAASVTCEVDGPTRETALAGSGTMKAPRGIRQEVVSGSALRTYRLAVAATGDYTQRYGGGTVAGGLAAITTTINLVDAIYEREVAIRLVLIANEDSIVFTDPATDGYTSDSVGALVSENQTKLDAVIGDANYDIGHVFDGRSAPSGFSFQGQATLAAVCRSGAKGRGVSITRSVQPFSVIAYYSTAHEMGHQFGASHTFNATSGACATQRSSTTAYEPGTGSTIMGYRFTCAPEDLMSSDTYFHNESLEQITAYTTVGNGNCPAPMATGNNIPTIDAGPNYTIPQGTPFILTATGTDLDGDALTYCWEEFDLGNPGPPNTDDGSRPIFRSFAPTVSASRTFPRLLDILFGSATFGESLPVTTRTMNFRVTARDNRANGGGINSAAMQLNVRADAGPFTVTQPLSTANWTTGSSQTVTWSVANTSSAPVSCASVRILLSIDGGNSFPIILAANTANDGSEIVTIPSTPGSARVKVEAVGNVFFNMSQGFIITGLTDPTPKITSFTPQTGLPGSSVTITGTNFINPSAVRFNGIDATFTVNSTAQITATVPAGNTSGPITVTTSGGTATSFSSFVGPPSYAVSGHIADAGNNPLAGVTVNFQLDSQGTITSTSTVTDASGNYASGNVGFGCQNRVVVTPSKTGVGFSPLWIAFVSTKCLTGNATANFTATQAGANTIRLSQATYSVNEGANSLTATIMRSGDTSGSASVAFTTFDTDTFTVGCSDKVNNLGGAFGRCDYATTADTLVFASGEAAKTIVIPIINDAFAEGDETFFIGLSNASGATLGTPSIATVTINDNEGVDGPNPIFTTPFFVRQHYLDFLSREPEPGEPWTAVLNNCSDVNNNPACDRLTVSAAFFGSPEFQLKGYFVYRFYKLAFNRLPTYNEIVVDMRAVTGQTPTEVFQKKAAFANSFVQRTEFANTYNALSNANYVSTLMGRYSLTQITTPDPAAPDGSSKVTLTTAELTNRLDGIGGTLTRAQVLRAIADSDQVFNAEFNQAFVAMQYYGYLRRAPETAGYNSWLNYLIANPTDSRTMVNGFMNSVEYRLRFGP